MIKASTIKMTKTIRDLFNNILRSGKYPTLWNRGFISSLPKTGDLSDPNNFRGITLTSCLGKLFNKILSRRLYKFRENNNLRPAEQIAYCDDSRTTDHIFVLHSLIEKYKLSKKTAVFMLCRHEKGI